MYKKIGLRASGIGHQGLVALRAVFILKSKLISPVFPPIGILSLFDFLPEKPAGKKKDANQKQRNINDLRSTA